MLASLSGDLHERLQEAVGGLMPLRWMPFPAGLTELLVQVGGSAVLPDVLVLDPGPSQVSTALRISGQLDQQHPGVSVILVSGLGAEISLPAMRAGVLDVLDPSAPVEEIRSVLDRAVVVAARSLPLRHAAGAAAPPTGRVISVVSPKGGVGKTTVATNLAVGLAGFQPSSTVLVDLDLQFGDVASALDLTPEYSLRDAVGIMAGADTMILKTYLTQHATGVYVLCGSNSPADADDITAQQVSDLLGILASEFRYIVVDTAPGLSEHTLSAMDQSTDLVLVTSMDVPGVRGLSKELQMLSALNMVPHARHVVLNLADRRGGLLPNDVEATLGTGIDVLLPRSKTAPRSVNQGVPLLQSGGRDPLTKQLRKLVSRFAPPRPPEPTRHRGRHYSRGQER